MGAQQPGGIDSGLVQITYRLLFFEGVFCTVPQEVMLHCEGTVRLLEHRSNCEERNVREARWANRSVHSSCIVCSLFPFACDTLSLFMIPAKHNTLTALLTLLMLAIMCGSRRHTDYLCGVFLNSMQAL